MVSSRTLATVCILRIFAAVARISFPAAMTSAGSSGRGAFSNAVRTLHLFEPADLLLVHARLLLDAEQLLVGDALEFGEAVGKKFLRQKGQVILRSMNPRYDDIIIKECDQFVIAGVVLGIVEGAL